MERNEKLLMGKITFHAELVTTDIVAQDCQQAIAATAQALLDADYVQPTYPNAVWQREQIFATGLALEDICVAIPHTDSVHVKQSAIAIGVLRNPVPFTLMGEPDVQGDVSLLLMLAIADPNMQIDVLQRMMELFQTEGAMRNLYHAGNAEAVANQFIEMMEGTV